MVFINIIKLMSMESIALHIIIWIQEYNNVDLGKNYWVLKLILIHPVYKCINVCNRVMLHK